jgi:hypothetical protein
MTYTIWQWGRRLFTGSLERCEALRDRWMQQHGNIELEILPDFVYCAPGEHA